MVRLEKGKPDRHKSQALADSQGWTKASGLYLAGHGRATEGFLVRKETVLFSLKGNNSERS